MIVFFFDLSLTRVTLIGTSPMFVPDRVRVASGSPATIDGVTDQCMSADGFAG
jgi:hypothetical protein